MQDLIREVEKLKKRLDKTAVTENTSGGSGAPTDAEYLVLSANGSLTGERVLTAGDGLAGTDAGAGSTYTLAVNVDDTTIEIAADTLQVVDGVYLEVANNLSDVVAATAFANIKQSATTGATGVVELATDDEARAGTDTSRVITPANLMASARALPCDGRLTLTTATPVLTSNVTGATTVYFTPYLGNRIALYTGSLWKQFTFNEISVAVPSTVYKLFDIYAYDNGGSVALETTDWSQSTAAISDATNATPIVITSAGHGLSNNDVVAVTGVGGNTAANGIWSIANVAADTFELAGSTGSGAYTSGGTWYRLNESRATDITLQNGIYVKSGTATRRYLGTAMTTDTSGETESSTSNQLLYNYYNRIVKTMAVLDVTNHTYTSSTVRVYRNQNSNKVAFVVGVSEDSGQFGLFGSLNFDSGDGTVTVGLGINRTNGQSNVVQVRDVFDSSYLFDWANFAGNAGYNFVQLTQAGAATSPDFRQAIIRGLMPL